LIRKSSEKAMLDRRVNTPVALFSRPESVPPFGRQLLDRTLSSRALGKLLREVRRQSRTHGGFYYPSSGNAVWIFAVLRHPSARADFFRLMRVSPENFRDDEDCARAMAVAWMLGDLARWCDAEFDKWLNRFSRERRKVRTLHELGEGYEKHTRQQARLTLGHLEAAEPAIVCDAARFIGRWLEMEFSELRAPKLVADLVNETFGPRRKMTERRVRYLRGW
jgi:hypothetical protein